MKHCSKRTPGRRQFIWVSIFTIVCSVLDRGQSQTTSEAEVKFEVASIKRAAPGSSLKSIQIPTDSNILRIRGLSLKELIRVAWGQAGGGLHPGLVHGGPDWLDAQKYDIVAKPEGHRIVSRDERRRMLRQLIIERFHLQSHWEPKTLNVYALTLAKNGSLMKKRFPADNGEPFRLPFTSSSLIGRNASIPQLVYVIQSMIPLVDPERADLPVVDQTGLTGTFDFDIKFEGDASLTGAAAVSAAEVSRGSNFFSALQSQAGLRLEVQKVSVETLAIDGATAPTED